MQIKTVEVPPDWEPRVGEIEMGPDDLLHVKVGVSSQDMGDGLPPWIPGHDDLVDIRAGLEAVLGKDHRILVTHFGIELVPIDHPNQVSVEGFLDMGEHMPPWIPGPEDLVSVRKELREMLGGEQEITTLDDVEDYLDECIVYWREVRDRGADLVLTKAATYYIDAFQSARRTIFGSILEPNDATIDGA